MKDDDEVKGNGNCALLFSARVSCIPAAAEHTASIQTPRSQPHSEEPSIVLAWGPTERYAVPQALPTMLLLGLHSESPRLTNVTVTHSSGPWRAPTRLCKYLALLETSPRLVSQDALWLAPICAPVPVYIKRTIVLRNLRKVRPSGDERGKQWLWLAFFTVIIKEGGRWEEEKKRDTNQQLNHDKHHQLQNVIDFNLTAGLHTFVRRVCFVREKRASRCILCAATSRVSRRGSLLSIVLISIIFSFFLFLSTQHPFIGYDVITDHF